MPRLLASRVVTARKPHRCACCLAVAVNPGEAYTRQVYEFDGSVYTWVLCADCAALVSVVYEWAWCPDEGVGADSYQAWAWENRDDPTHGTAARAYLTRAGMETDDDR